MKTKNKILTWISIVLIFLLCNIFTICVNATQGDEYTEINRYSFGGKELDKTDLYYFGARYYDAKQIGRFTSPDPIAGKLYNPQSLNRYAYCLNNPTKYIDPTGKEEVNTLMLETYDHLAEHKGVQYRGTPLIINFPDTVSLNNYIAYADSYTTALENRVTEFELLKQDRNTDHEVIVSKFNELRNTKLSLKNGEVITKISTTGEDNIFNRYFNNPGEIPPIISKTAGSSISLDNIIVNAHGVEHEGQYYISSTQNDNTIVYLADDVTNTLENKIDTSKLKKDAHFIFQVCYGDSTVDAQAISNALGITVYASPYRVHNHWKTISSSNGVMHIYILTGVFNEYNPN